MFVFLIWGAGLGCPTWKQLLGIGVSVRLVVCPPGGVGGGVCALRVSVGIAFCSIMCPRRRRVANRVALWSSPELGPLIKSYRQY